MNDRITQQPLHTDVTVNSAPAPHAQKPSTNSTGEQVDAHQNSSGSQHNAIAHHIPLPSTLYPPEGTLLETAANAAAAQPSEDATIEAAMQEAASIVMQAHEKMHCEHPYQPPPILHQVDYDMHSPATCNELPTAPGESGRTSLAEEETRKRAGNPQNGYFKPHKRSRAPPKPRVSWEERLRQLQAFKEEHGHLLIPTRYKPSNLGKFVHNTREQYKLYNKQTPDGYKKKCSLTAERIQQLEALGFCWTTERSKKQQDSWQKRFEQLKEFREKHGHCLVPHGYTEDPSFSEWIHRQRTSYNTLLKDEEDGEVGFDDEELDEEGAPVSTTTATETPMPAVKEGSVQGDDSTSTPKKRKRFVNPEIKERFEKLKELGFNFAVHSDRWMEHWNKLKEYKEKYGDCQVPTHFPENPKLGRWVHTQRHQRRLQEKGKKSCMTQERIDLLDQLGFSWEVRPSLDRPRTTWYQRFEELKIYYEKNGNHLVDPVGAPHLYAWCREQKQRLRALHSAQEPKEAHKRMSPDRVQALQTIGFTRFTQLVEPPKSGPMEEPISVMTQAPTEIGNDVPVK